MRYLADVRRLCEILAAECDGHQIDHQEALELVQRLRHHCPDIANTLGRISSRLEPASQVA